MSSYTLNDGKIRVMYWAHDPTEQEVKIVDDFLDYAERRNLLDLVNSVIVDEGIMTVSFLYQILLEFTIDNKSGKIMYVRNIEGVG